jgi:hypothetical protein
MFHRVIRGQDPLWARLYNDFIVPTSNQYIVSQYRPGAGTATCLRSDGVIGPAPSNDGNTVVDVSKWAKVFTNEDFITIDNVKYALEVEGAQYAVFDELNSSSVDFYENFFAELVNSPYAYLGPKMALHIGPGFNLRYEKSSFVGPIDNALQAGAIISPEVYFRHSDYCEIRLQNSPNSKAEDTWEQNFIKPNFNYLIRRRVAKGSRSIIAPVVPTTDQYLDLAIPNDAEKTNANASAFLQRIIYNIAQSKLYSTFSTKVSTGYQCNGIGSYKWSVNAFGFGLENESMNWAKIIAEVEPTGPGNIRDELNAMTVAADVRISGFINAWNKYCNLGRNNQITPPSSGNTICKGTEVKQAGYHYSSINEETKSYSLKPTPDPANLINKKTGSQKAFLKKLNYISKEYDGRKRFNGPSDNSYIIPQKIETFDLWVTETNHGYATRGVSMASRYYKKYYPQYFEKMPIQVKGICSDEVEYNYLSRFIRQQQVDSVTDHNNLMLLEVPASGIRCIGLIPSFKGGIETQNSGIPIAPEYNFEFIVLRDLNDTNDTAFNDELMEFSKAINQPKQQRINDDFSLPAMFSVNLKGGDIKSNSGAKTTPTGSNKNGAQNQVKSGTQRANGTGR